MRGYALLLLCCILAVSSPVCRGKDPKGTAVERDGSSPQRAVVIRGPMHGYVDQEWKWIAQHFPGSSMLPYQQGLRIQNGRWIDSITFPTADRKRQTVYFDITGVK
jgi:hypothetical protein